MWLSVYNNDSLFSEPGCLEMLVLLSRRCPHQLTVPPPVWLGVRLHGFYSGLEGNSHFLPTPSVKEVGPRLLVISDYCGILFFKLQLHSGSNILFWVLFDPFIRRNAISLWLEMLSGSASWLSYIPDRRSLGVLRRKLRSSVPGRIASMTGEFTWSTRHSRFQL